MKLEVRSKGEAGHRRLGKFFGLEPEIVEVNEAEAAVLEGCTALLCRRMSAKAAVADVPPPAGAPEKK